jgi:hypothetical protein
MKNKLEQQRERERELYIMNDMIFYFRSLDDQLWYLLIHNTCSDGGGRDDKRQGDYCHEKWEHL